MRELTGNGKSQTQAAATPGLGLRTVQRWVAYGVFRARKHCAFFSQVDAFGPYLEKRVADGCRSATTLWREIGRQAGKVIKERMPAFGIGCSDALKACEKHGSAVHR